jgi:hypothetical protein
MKLHTESFHAEQHVETGRNLVLGSSIGIATAVLGEASVRKLSSARLSNDTVCYKIGDPGRI